MRRTLERLLHEGLDRHDAVHAIGSVLSAHMYHIMKEQDPGTDPNAAYYRAARDFAARRAQ